MDSTKNRAFRPAKLNRKTSFSYRTTENIIVTCPAPIATRTIADIEADIVAVKHANPNWLENAVHTALITAYTNEKNLLSATQPGYYISSFEFY